MSCRSVSALIRAGRQAPPRPARGAAADRSTPCPVTGPWPAGGSGRSERALQRRADRKPGFPRTPAAAPAARDPPHRRQLPQLAGMAVSGVPAAASGDERPVSEAEPEALSTSSLPITSGSGGLLMGGMPSPDHPDLCRPLAAGTFDAAAGAWRARIGAAAAAQAPGLVHSLVVTGPGSCARFRPRG